MVRIATALAALVFIAGCAVNPVTGKRDLSLVGEQWELDVGARQYSPLIQAQGGEFTLDPGLVEYVRSVGQRIARVADRDLPYEFHIINESVPNAWALPGGKISINRGLLTEMDSEAELAAVLGHEVVHSAARHGAQNRSRSILLQGAVLAGGLAAGAATDDGRYTSAALLGGMIGAQLVAQRYSRDAEREADRYGMRYMKRAGYNPRGAVELQETFVRLSEGRRSDLFSALFASHPPSRDRVEANRAILAELGDSGEIGRDTYRRQLQRLVRAKPAYDAYDAGREALEEGDADTALAKANEAIRLESREAIFHGLRGDALSARGNHRGAEAAFSAALARDASWFYHHLRRGQARAEVGNLYGARADLRSSLARMPTPAGHFSLGHVERRSGNRSAAVEHFRVAAQSATPIGQQARKALQDMGVSAGP